MPDTYYSIALDRIRDWEQNYTDTYVSFEKEISKKRNEYICVKGRFKIGFPKNALETF